MRKEKQLKMLDELENKYRLDNYRDEQGTIDFFNFFNDYYAALCKTFGAKPLKNECPEVAEARKTLMLAVYEEREDKGTIDFKMEQLSKEFSADYKRYNDECYKKLINTFSNI